MLQLRIKSRGSFLLLKVEEFKVKRPGMKMEMRRRRKKDGLKKLVSVKRAIRWNMDNVKNFNLERHNYLAMSVVQVGGGV